MSGTNDDGDSAPDFSFLGGDAAPDADASFDFTEPAAPTNSEEEAPAPAAPVSKPAAKRPAKSAAKKLASKSSASKQVPSVSTAAASAGAKQKRKSKPIDETPESGSAESATATVGSGHVARKTFNMLLGYAAALTLFFLFLLLTGRLSGAHQLESLPDIRPLQKDEFQLVPESVSLPRNHSLQIGDSRQFGDVILTAEKITLEPLQFVHMTTGKEAEDMTTKPVLKLWLKMENVSANVSFPPWDIGLMVHRSQRGAEISTDENSVTNSWLLMNEGSGQDSQKVLNFLHPTESSFNLVGQNSGQVIGPGESLTTYVASSLSIPRSLDGNQDCRWRIQIRKGVNQSSGNAVTTLVDVEFTSDQVVDAAGA